MVLNISKTEKIQSMYQWMVHIRKNNSLQSIPRINTGSLPIHSLCIYYSRNYTRLTSKFNGDMQEDHSLRKAFRPGIIHEPTDNTNIHDETCTIAVIEGTVLKVKTWKDAVFIKFNESKQNSYVSEADNS